MKVYCSGCKYFECIPGKCKSPNNRPRFYNEAWKQAYLLSDPPSKLNKNNDCKWYKKKLKFRFFGQNILDAINTLRGNL
jgi:hypothetical protein